MLTCENLMQKSLTIYSFNYFKLGPETKCQEIFSGYDTLKCSLRIILYKYYCKVLMGFT